MSKYFTYIYMCVCVCMFDNGFVCKTYKKLFTLKTDKQPS